MTLMTGTLLESFNPDMTYNGLLKQAYALFTLANSYKSQLENYAKLLQGCDKRAFAEISNEVKAHRKTNTILTDALLAAETEVYRLKMVIIENGIKPN